MAPHSHSTRKHLTGKFTLKACHLFKQLTLVLPYRFLRKNSLTHVVRAHEVPTNGFFFHFDKKCATIFSCSHYCGNNNECAVMFVDRDQLRVVRIDTTNNASATDI